MLHYSNLPNRDENIYSINNVQIHHLVTIHKKTLFITKNLWRK